MNVSNIYDLRLYLLSRGFVPCDESGILYRLVIDGHLIFQANVVYNKLTATMPDFQYNAVNTYSKRNNEYEMQIKTASSKTDIDNFISKMTELYNKKGL